MVDLKRLRDAGWTVAVHNDFRLRGRMFTFWLLTHKEAERYVIGEGTTDEEALRRACRNAGLSLPVRARRFKKRSKILFYHDGFRKQAPRPHAVRRSQSRA